MDHKQEPKEVKDHKYDHKRRGPRRPSRQPPAPDSFRGKHKELQGHVYTYDNAARAYQYSKTTDAITEWVKMNLKFPMDIWRAMTTLEDPKTDEWKPKAPASKDDRVEEEIFKEEIKQYMKRKSEYDNNRCNVFTVVYGQCDEPLQAKLRGQEDWTDIFESHDLVKLMKSVKAWMINQEGSRCPVAATDASIAALYKIRQNRYESLTEYKKRFVAATEVLEHTKVNLGRALVGLTDKTLKKEKSIERSKATPDEIKDMEKKTLNKYLACRFIAAADRARYTNAAIYLENEFVAGSDKWPEDATGAYNFLENWKQGTINVDTPSNDGVSFAQGGGPLRHEDGQDRRGKGPRSSSNIQCFKCGKFGHYSTDNKCNPEDVKNWRETVNHMTGFIEPDNTDSPNDDDNSTDYRVTMCTVPVGSAEPDYEGVSFCLSGTNNENSGHVMNQQNERIESVMTHSFNKDRSHVIPRGSVGLDSMSSVDVFGDPRLLHNIRKARGRMRIMCNAGEVVVTEIGDLRGYGTVWYHPGAIANILSLSRAKNKFKVTYDSDHGNFFTLRRKDGTTRIFKPTNNGLYASQLIEPKKAVAMVTTVSENMKSFTKREVKKAREARRLMEIIGRPNENHMRHIVMNNQLRNCNVTDQDIRNAHDIFGPDIGSLKGKTTRRGEPHVDLSMQPIPQEIVTRHREVVICFDVMYVNGIPFAVSISRAIKFCTVEALENRKAETLLTSLKRIRATYARRGFLANMIAADNEFASLEGPLSNEGMALNVVARDEHVPEIERHIRTLKERCRAVFNTLPFNKMPNRMIVELVYAMNFWIHAFPACDGVSEHISPREIVTGVSLDANKHCVVPFGAYVQTHEQHDNSMATRTIGAITLRPSGNAQGGHYFLSLQTGRRIIRNKWTEVPMPADVVGRVEKMAGSRTVNRLQFGDRNNAEEENEDAGDAVSISSNSSEDDDSDQAEQYDTDQAPDDSAQSDANDAHGDSTDRSIENEREAGPVPPKAEDRVVRIKMEPETAQTPDHHAQDANANASDDDWADAYDYAHDEPHEPREPLQLDAHDDSVGQQSDEMRPPNEVEDIGTTGVPAKQGTTRAGVPADGDEAEASGRTTDDDNNIDERFDASYGKRTREGMRNRKRSKLNVAQMEKAGLLMQATVSDARVIAPTFDATALSGVNDSLAPLISTLLTQYGVKKGLRVFGKDGDAAVMEEMRQLHEMDVMRPRSPTTLSSGDKKKALQYLMFLKRKRNGTIKGRGCADGRKQRQLFAKNDVSSPTIATESIFLIITIAGNEERDVMTMDVPGAFLQTPLNGEIVIIRMEGRMAELLAMIDPKLYRSNIVIENGKPVLYAELQKALYGMLQSALRFWEQVVADLHGLGFVTNPYDRCVANRTVNGAQQTIGWHVDDFIVTHVDPEVNDRLADWFNAKYGRRTPLSVHRGKIHEYLGMTINFEDRGKVRITMFDYIAEMLAESPADFPGIAATPAGNHLFETHDDDGPALDEKRAMTFHHITAKSLFLAKRARPDILLAVAFLCTRVRAPNHHDWKKMGRLLQYLRGTASLPLTLEVDDSHVIKWWVDAAFAVSGDMRSHSGGTMSMGRGSICSSSMRQKLNTRSSTEAELVGVDDFMPQILWTRLFLEAQGYKVKNNIIHQDNQSAILLETNGRASSGRRTRHINIKYFFICDRVSTGEVNVKYCPSDEMVSDFFTKPLQGSTFRKFRRLILNLDDDHA